MKFLTPPDKLNKQKNPFYSLSLEDRKKVVENFLKEMEQSATSTEARTNELRLMRGEN